MRSRVKTGDVLQIRKNGPNYVTLGKVRGADGVDYIVATKNGNLTPEGTLKKPFTRTINGRQKRIKPKIHVLEGTHVKRVHGSRPIDMESVISRGGNLVRSHLQRTTPSTGVRTDAPNIMAQLAELKASL